MKNLRELFNLYHAGFQDFGPWLDHYREMHRRHPLDVPEFGAEWLRRWSEVGRLLEEPANVMVFDNGQWWSIRHGTVQTCIVYCSKKHHNERRRIVLLDGTIVREWPALTMGERIRSGLKETFCLKTSSPYIHHQFGVGK